jgi:hypothetical protein
LREQQTGKPAVATASNDEHQRPGALLDEDVGRTALPNGEGHVDGGLRVGCEIHGFGQEFRRVLAGMPIRWQSP